MDTTEGMYSDFDPTIIFGHVHMYLNEHIRWDVAYLKATLKDVSKYNRNDAHRARAIELLFLMEQKHLREKAKVRTNLSRKEKNGR